MDMLLGGGIACRQVTMFAAPPGTGKTQLGMDHAERLRVYRPVLYISTELEDTELAARYAGAQLGERAADLLAHRTMKPEAIFRALAERDDGEHAYPVHVRFLNTLGEKDPIAAIYEYANTLRVGDEWPIIIIDYVQMLAVVESDHDDELVRTSMSKVANRLRSLAQKLDAPILAISSVSRAFYGKSQSPKWSDDDDPITWLAAGKESGDIEYFAAVFIYVDTHSECDGDGVYPARLIVAKARDGKKGFVGMRFNGRLGRWDEDTKVVGEIKAKKAAAQNRKSEQKAKVKDTVDETNIAMLRAAILDASDTKGPFKARDDLLDNVKGKGCGQPKKVTAYRRLKADKEIVQLDRGEGGWIYSARMAKAVECLARWLPWVAASAPAPPSAEESQVAPGAGTAA